MEDIINGIISNRGDLLVTLLRLLASFFLAIVAGYPTIRVIKKRYKGAEEERQKNAKKELIDTIESQVISQKEIYSNNIEGLISAAERNYSVSLSEVSSVTLLQDVAFRIQESKHLDSEQKREYSNILSDEIGKEKEKEERTPLPNITARIEDIIKSTEDNEVAEELQKLKEEIEEASYQTVWNSKDGMKYMFDADEDIVDGMGNKKFQDTRLLPYILMIIVYTTGTYLLLRLIGF